MKTAAQVLLLAIGLVFVMAMAAAVQAHAGVPCGVRADIIKMLADKYNESPRAVAVAGQTNLVEIFSSKIGSWTMLVTQPMGATCIVGAGQGWTLIEQTHLIPGKDM